MTTKIYSLKRETPIITAPTNIPLKTSCFGNLR